MRFLIPPIQPPNSPAANGIPLRAASKSTDKKPQRHKGTKNVITVLGRIQFSFAYAGRFCTIAPHETRILHPPRDLCLANMALNGSCGAGTGHPAPVSLRPRKGRSCTLEIPLHGRAAFGGVDESAGTFQLGTVWVWHATLSNGTGEHVRGSGKV